VSIIKSVPNLISYLHEFPWIFSQFLAIYFELFLSGSDFYFGKMLMCGAQRLVAVLPRAAPWLVAVGGAIRTRACGIKSAPVRPRSDRSPPLAPPRLMRRRSDRTVSQARAALFDASAVVPTVLAQSCCRLHLVSRATALSDADHAPRLTRPPHHPSPKPHPV
jgi:hypothetical protein